MATKQRTPSQIKNRSSKRLTFADTYGLGLIANELSAVDRLEIFEYLSPNAKKVARAFIDQSSAKKSPRTRRTALKP